MGLECANVGMDGMWWQVPSSYKLDHFLPQARHSTRIVPYTNTRTNVDMWSISYMWNTKRCDSRSVNLNIFRMLLSGISNMSSGAPLVLYHDAVCKQIIGAVYTDISSIEWFDFGCAAPTLNSWYFVNDRGSHHAIWFIIAYNVQGVEWRVQASVQWSTFWYRKSIAGDGRWWQVMAGDGR